MFFNGQVAQLVEHHLSKQKVASSNPGSAWSWGERRRRSAKGPIGSMYVASRFTLPTARKFVRED